MAAELTEKQADMLARWWTDADEATRQEVRDADYFDAVAPSSDVAGSLARAGVVAFVGWVEQPGSQVVHVSTAASDLLRRLDAKGEGN